MKDLLRTLTPWHAPRTGWVLVALVVLLWLAVYGLRCLGPSDVLDKDQERPTAYVLDLLTNRALLVQRDDGGAIASKPPLYTWCAGATALITGRVSDFSMTWPCALATLGCALLIAGIGSTAFGAPAGVVAALLYLLSIAVFRQVHLMRTDAVFAFFTFATAALAYRTWCRGDAWWGVALLASAATLTKGPLGVVLAAAGLLGIAWEWRSGHRTPPGRSWREAAGAAALFAAVTLGWFLAADWVSGGGVFRKMIRQELVGMAVEGTRGAFPGSRAWEPVFYFLTRFFPWSLLAMWGIYRAVRTPAAATEERQWERFCVAYLCGGLAVFALGSHQRQDHVLPLLPAAALLAGRQLAPFIAAPERARLRLRIAAGAVIAALFGALLYYGTFARKSLAVQRTRAAAELASTIRTTAGERLPILYFECPQGVQFFLNDCAPRASMSDVMTALASPQPTFVATREPEAVERRAARENLRVHRVAETFSAGEEPFLVLLGNVPELAAADRGAVVRGGLVIEAERGRPDAVTSTSVFVRTSQAVDWRLRTLDGAQDVSVRVETADGARRESVRRRLEPQEVWSYRLPAAAADPGDALRSARLMEPRSFRSPWAAPLLVLLQLAGLAAAVAAAARTIARGQRENGESTWRRL